MARREALGLTLAGISSATFGTSGTFAAGLFAAGWTPGAAVTTRITIAALVLTVPALLTLRRHSVGVRPLRLRQSARTLATYGIVAVAGAQLCYFNAVNHLSVAVALLLEYSGILLVVGWMWLRHQQRPRLLTGGGAAVALVGLVLVLDLAGHHRVDGIGVLWGLGAAIGLATYFVISADDTDAPPPLVVAWGGLVVGAAVLLVADVTGAVPYAAPRADVTLLHTRVSWLVPVLGLSLVAAVVAYVTGIAGVRLLGARLASFVGLLEVCFAVVFAWLLLDQSMTAIQLAGGALIIAGIALVRIDEMRTPGPDTVILADPELAALERAGT